ncbi:hypothetical protein NBRC103581_00344 [Gluconobacter wancherniae NBRC 103581]|nr:hypothetical protein NBRC103581_00344 [Gluconobacter wancherniae NBRC 103581]
MRASSVLETDSVVTDLRTFQASFFHSVLVSNGSAER